jgi:hypothetical protein
MPLYCVCSILHLVIWFFLCFLKLTRIMWSIICLYISSFPLQYFHMLSFDFFHHNTCIFLFPLVCSAIESINAFVLCLDSFIHLLSDYSSIGSFYSTICWWNFLQLPLNYEYIGKVNNFFLFYFCLWEGKLNSL